MLHLEAKGGTTVEYSCNIQTHIYVIICHLTPFSGLYSFLKIPNIWFSLWLLTRVNFFLYHSPKFHTWMGEIMDNSESIIFLREIRIVLSPLYITFVYMEWRLLFFYTVTSFWSGSSLWHVSLLPNNHNQNDRIFSTDVCSNFPDFWLHTPITLYVISLHYENG